MTDVLYAHVKDGVVVDISVHDRDSSTKKTRKEHLDSLGAVMQMHIDNDALDYYFEVDEKFPVSVGDTVDDNNNVIRPPEDIEVMRSEVLRIARSEMEAALLEDSDSVSALDYTDKSVAILLGACAPGTGNQKFFLNKNSEPVKMAGETAQGLLVKIAATRARIFEKTLAKIEAAKNAATVDALKALIILALMLVFALPANAASSVGVFIRPYPFSTITNPVAYQTYAFDSVTGKLYVYNGSTWVTSVPPFSNYTAVAGPTVNDDSGDGYAVGSIWFDSVAKIVYTATSVAPAAAVWDVVTGDNIGTNNLNKFIASQDLTGDYVASNVVCTVPVSGRTITSVAGVAFISSVRTPVPSFTYTYPVASWTYDFIQSNGTITHSNVATDADPPGTSGLLVQLVKVNATDITEIQAFNNGFPALFSLFRNTAPSNGLPVVADITQPSGVNFKKMAVGNLANGSALAGWITLNDGTNWVESATLPLNTIDPAGSEAGAVLGFNGANWAATGPGIPVIPQTTSFNVLPGSVYTVDNTAADVTATLPDAALFTGQTCTIILIAGGTNDLNVATSLSQLIQGVASPFTTTTVGTKITLTSDGINWY